MIIHWWEIGLAFIAIAFIFFGYLGRTVQKRPTRYERMENAAKIQSEEYITRLGAVASTLRTQGLSAFVASTFFSQVYLIGSTIEPVRRKFLVIVYSNGKVVLVVPRMEREHLKHMPGVSQVIYYSEYPAPGGKQWIDALVKQFSPGDRIACEEAEVTRAIEARGHARIGSGPILEIADVHCPHRVGVKDAWRLCEEHGMVKDEAELRLIRHACAMADRGVAKIRKTMHIGIPAVRIYKLEAEVKKAMTMLMGYDPMRSKVITGMWVGPNADPHYIAELWRMIACIGPHIVAAFVMAHGCMVECERTVFLGTPNPRQIHYFNLMMRAREYAMSQLVPGITAGELDRRVRRFMVDELGIKEDDICHGVGHGIGLLTFHNLPYLADVDKWDDVVLVPGMVVTIEPGIYVTQDPTANGSYRHSDVILTTKDGYEILTKSPTKLEDCIVSNFKPLQWVVSGVVKFAMGLWR